MSVVKPGERFRCAECGTEVVVIRQDQVLPHCCGSEMESVSSSAAAR